MTATEQESGGVNGINHDVPNSFAKPSIISPSHASLEEHCAQIHCAISQFLASDPKTDLLRQVQEKTKEAIGVVAKALDTYRLSEISLSYNGGKDCLVLLIIFLHGLYEHHLQTATTNAHASDSKRAERNEHFGPIQSVYIKTPHPFQEVETFVEDSEQTYSLNLRRYTTPMKAAFASYLADYPSVRAIFVGTRRTDPHGATLTHFDETDHGWPKFMRIHPVIDWHYVEIWSFIKHLNVPYCTLYDKGYTSLGGTNDTWPNPALRLPGSTSHAPQFRPAHELMLDEEERLGRERGVSGNVRSSTEEKRDVF